LQPAIHNYGGSWLFNGNSGTGSFCAVDKSLHLTGDMTLEAWIDIDALTNYRYILNCASSGELLAENYLYGFAITSTGAILYLHEYGAGSNEIQITVATPIAINTAYHIVLVRDNAAKTVAVYVNAVFIENLTYVNVPAGGTKGYVTIGNSTELTTNEFAGQISDVAIYSGKLAPARITSHYTAGTT
ncbi:MAG: LamG domain-containing protein, partial [Candidatus Thorarchaeota archaeon]